MTGLVDEVVLTPAQLQVVRQPWLAKTLVTAGAGAGKTTTLAYRLEYLTGGEGLEAAEVLVLSFSRASVRELRDRVDLLARTASRVRAQTFDGWALALLRQVDPSRDDLHGTSFDERIMMATEAINEGVVESFEHGPPAHVVIDEVQDLVGVRREMVEALLDRFSSSCGFTVVGDQAQSVYGFQVTDMDQRAEETNRFFRWVRDNYSEDLIEVALSDNFRALTPEARIALPMGERLQNLPADRAAANAAGSGIYEELRCLLGTLPDFGDLNDPFAQDSLKMANNTTAILCRDNGQVLWLSEKLSSFDVPHRIQRSPRSRPAPAWLAQVLASTDGVFLNEQRFHDLVALLPNMSDNAVRVWRSLRRVAPARGNQLDIDALCRAVAEGRLPDELTGATASPLTLSTVHRAKGLEFDRVLVVSPAPLAESNANDADFSAEARLLYVAMTRSRYDLYRLDIPKQWHIRKATRMPYPIDRWYIGGYKKWARNGIEATEADVCHEAPAGIREPFANPAATQLYLRKRVQPGDEVKLLRLHDLPASSTEAPPFGIFHLGTPIGEVSERFRGDLWRLLKTSRRFEVGRWPLEISGLRVDALETVAGSSAVTERNGLGERGVWIAPRLCGLGKFHWAEKIAEGGIEE